jgi:serine phosphatase RsbU (regulator of sigma subunit)
MISGASVEVEQPLFLMDEAPAQTQSAWSVLIVDDEPAIHDVTTMVLGGVRFRGRRLSFISAHNSAEARQLLASHDDIAVILLDVVMETEDAGLRLVRYIRDELGNHLVRIILRTGQAGQAPERQVVLEYDINDYKEKTELTAQKLSTSVIAALRGFETLTELARLNCELEARVAQRTRELELANARLQQSLTALEQGERAGRRVQFKMLPPPNWEVGTYHFSHWLMPSELMSGDFVDYFQIDQRQVGFYIADVSGHGVASAFVTVYLKRFVASALEAKRQGQPSVVDDPAQLLAQLNSELLREKVGKHIAIWYAVLDTETAALRYANAGATPYPLCADALGTRFLATPSTPAGLFDTSAYVNETKALPGSFRLLLCSDGVLELLPESTAELRHERLRAALRIDTRSLEAVRVSLGIDSRNARPDDLALLMIGRDVAT